MANASGPIAALARHAGRLANGCSPQRTRWRTRSLLRLSILTPVALMQLPCAITGDGISVIPNVLPDPLAILLGIFVG